MSARKPMVMRRLPLAPIAVGLLAAAAVTGCGSSSATDESTSRAPSTTRSTATVTRTATRTASHDRSSTPTAGATTTATAGQGRCVAADLALSYLGGQGAAGHGALGFALRNTSRAACRTYGYPGVQLLDAGDGPLPTHPTRTTDDFFGHADERAFTLEPGASASFRLGVSHVGSGGSDAGCTTAHGLQVIAPDDTATVRVTIPGGAAECGGAVTVTPLQPGSGALSR